MRHKIVIVAMIGLLALLPATASARGQFCYCKGTKEICLVDGKWTPSGSTLCKPVRYPRH